MLFTDSIPSAIDTAPPASVLIVGGGIAGLASALALAQQGIASLVLEQAPAFSELGAGIQLTPNALRVLEQLGLLNELLPYCCEPAYAAMRDLHSGRLLCKLELGPAVRQRHDMPYLTVRRKDLHHALLQAARSNYLIELRTHSKVDSYIVKQGRVQLELAGNQEQLAPQGDVLIACDGIWSTIFQESLPDEKTAHASMPRYTGHMAYRALIPIERLPDATNWTRKITTWWGAKAHIVHYPVAGGKLLNLIALVEQPSYDMAQYGWSVPVQASEVQNALTTASRHRLHQQLLGLLYSADNWYAWPLFARQPMRGWSQGSTTLVGDAAHPMLPYMAQGAAMALEDAWVLAQCLANAAMGAPESVAAALQQYENLRYERTERMVGTAVSNGRIFHASGLLAHARNAWLSLRGSRLEDFDWIYQWHPAFFDVPANS